MFVLPTVPQMLSVKQVSCEYQLYSHWLDRTLNQTERTAPEADALTTRPPEQLDYISLAVEFSS